MKNPNKQAADAPDATPVAVPVPTHGGVYVNEGGVLRALEGGPPVDVTPAADGQQLEGGAA